MKPVVAPVKNVENLMVAYRSLADRDPSVPGMGLVFGFTGAGKTTAIAWLQGRASGIYVRAWAIWTPSAMLDAILGELKPKAKSLSRAAHLGDKPLNRAVDKVRHIIEYLRDEEIPLFVDEADYLLTDIKMLEALRDIHDETQVPVILIGVAGLERKLVHRQQLSRRISQWVEFQPADPEDARVLADSTCEVKVADDLVEKVHQAAKGSMGLMTVALARIEAYAKAQGWPDIDGPHWGNRPMFLANPPRNGKGGA